MNVEHLKKLRPILDMLDTIELRRRCPPKVVLDGSYLDPSHPICVAAEAAYGLILDQERDACLAKLAEHGVKP